MAYSAFTLTSVKKIFGIKVSDNQSLFDAIEPVEASDDVLGKFLQRFMPLAIGIGTEKARSEFIVAPILAEITELMQHQVSLFSGVEFDVLPEKGLNGFCDFILTGSNIQHAIETPILTVVEAKNDNIHSGLGQCIAEMIAAQLFNQNQQIIYGCVTTGSIWTFLKLEDKQIFIDRKEYYINNLNKILGILLYMVSSFNITLKK